MVQVCYIDFLGEFSLKGQPGDWVHDPWMDKKLTYEQLEVDGHKDCCSKLPLDTRNLGGRMNDDQISFVI